MTSRERVEAALRHEDPDRTPVFEYVLLSPVADQLIGRPYAMEPKHWPALLAEKGWERAVRQMAVDRLDLAERIGEDMIYVVPNPMPDQKSTEFEFVTEDLAGDPAETVARRNERRAEGFEKKQPDEPYRIYHELKAEMARRGLDLPILAPAYAHGVWTDVDLMATMSLDPEVARRHFELCTRESIAAVERYAELGLDQAGVGGDFAGNRPLISPQAYREFIMPEVRKVARRAHELGMRAVNASDGNLWSVIEDFLIGCEVDGYLEIDLHAGMDLRKLKVAYGDRVTLYGNLDCGNTLSFGTEDEVRRHVIECLEAGAGRGGHILCASNAITESVPLRNYVAVIRAYREFFVLLQFQT